MKYFTKLLNSEGEIEIGDHVKLNGGEGTVTDVSETSILVKEEDGEEHSWAKHVPVKMELFVCVHVEGEEALKEGTYLFHNPKDKLESKPFKKVGAVSKKATWVGPNEEFEEGDMLYLMEGSSISKPFSKMAKERPEWLDSMTIYFRCPTCKTFH